MAIFGNQNPGDTGRVFSVAHGTRFTPTSSGVVTKITVYIFPFQLNTDVVCAILDTTNTVIANGQTDNRIFAAAGGYSWEDFTFTTNPSIVSGTEYGLFAWADADNTLISIDDDGAPGKGWGGATGAYDDFSTNVYVQGTYVDRLNSIYATYTESAGRVASRRLLVGAGLAAKTAKFKPKRLTLPKFMPRAM